MSLVILQFEIIQFILPFSLERSTDQVIKPINLDALNSWVGKIPEEVLDNLIYIAPMLKILGYDPYANPPDYGKVNHFVASNMRSIEHQHEDWKLKSAEIINKRSKLREKINQLSKEYSNKDQDVKDLTDEYLLQKDKPEEEGIFR